MVSVWWLVFKEGQTVSDEFKLDKVFFLKPNQCSGSQKVKVVWSECPSKLLEKGSKGTLILISEIHEEYIPFHLVHFSSDGSFDLCCRECFWFSKLMSSCVYACVRRECFIHCQVMLLWVGEFHSVPKDWLHIISNRACKFPCVYLNFNIRILTW